MKKILPLYIGIMLGAIPGGLVAYLLTRYAVPETIAYAASVVICLLCGYLLKRKYNPRPQVAPTYAGFTTLVVVDDKSVQVIKNAAGDIALSIISEDRTSSSINDYSDDVRSEGRSSSRLVTLHS